MEEKIQRFDHLYACFVDRPVDGALVVAANDMATVFVAHAIQEFDSRSSSDIAFVLADAFEGPGSYVDRLLETVQRQQDALARAMEGLDEGDQALCAALIAPLPPVCADPEADPSMRLQALIAAMHARITGGDRRLIWCFSPLEILDPGGYGRLMDALLTMPRPLGLRLVIRDLLDSPCIPSIVDSRDESIVMVDFSITLDEMKQATSRRAVDPALPVERRLPAILELALFDHGAGRIDEAELKYRLIAAHEGPEASGIRPIAWHGLAEIDEQRGDLARARVYLELALTELGGQTIPPVQYTVVTALGRVSTALGDHRLAEECFACASVLAIAVHSHERCAANFEALGDARLALGRASEACNAWTTAAELWRRAGADDRGRAVERKIDEARPS